MLPQDILHNAEVLSSKRFFRVGLAVLAVVVLVAGYNWLGFRNMATQEAMDSAQLARNIAEGKGYTTLFIRPFSMSLVKQRQLEQGAVLSVDGSPDYSRIKGMHPDLANAPVYPVVLAALMKVLPFDYQASNRGAFWSEKARFSRYQPDFLIAVFNQLLFFLIILLIFLLARRLFDRGVAWLSAILLLGTELFWRFSVSGLSTMLLLLIFVGLSWCLVLLEEEVRTAKRGPNAELLLACMAGAIAGLGGLTRYSFAVVILPLLIFLAVFGGKRRMLLATLAAMTFAAVMTPWIVRNYSVSGKPFGTATYAAVETTILYPENKLQRSLEPNLGHLYPTAFWFKFNTNLRRILTDDLPRLGGSWVSAFFLAGLMMGFRNSSIGRLRYFLLGCIIMFSLTQALVQTQLSEASPDVNSENLLVLAAPLVLLFGVSLFFVLLDQIQLPLYQLRYVIISVFALVSCLPMLFVFLPPYKTAVAYPPYYPPAIQTVASWLKPSELAMSDIPWAVAWYGQRQCVWLTLKCTPDTKDPAAAHEDFFAINDLQKSINVLYLTPETMDSRFLTQWIRAGEQSWGQFILDSLSKKKVPEFFPLRESQSGWIPEQLVLADWQRWRKVQ